jgi:hypothetical protein
MNRKDRRIEVVPVWRTPLDHRLLVVALLGFIDQLREEANQTTAEDGMHTLPDTTTANSVTEATSDVTSTTDDGTEADDD